MKKSIKIMLFGIGIILTGILGAIYSLYCSEGGSFLVEYMCFIVPFFSAFAGPIILLIGLFAKD